MSDSKNGKSAWNLSKTGSGRKVRAAASGVAIRRRRTGWMVDFRKLGPRFYPEGCLAGGRKLYYSRAKAEGRPCWR